MTTNEEGQKTTTLVTIIKYHAYIKVFQEVGQTVAIWKPYHVI